MSYRDRSPLRSNNNSSNSNSEINITVTMATQLEINMAKDMLPEYSGGSKNLAYFIKQVENYIELLRRPDDNCLFNKLLFEQVKSKLVGDARDVLITSNFNRWSDIKEALLQRFGDPRSEELLAHDLNICYQKSNESYEQYFEIIKRKLQVLIEHVSIRTANHAIKIEKESMYTIQALSVFKAGILEPYCTHLMNITITTLEQALYECRKYDNDRAQVSFMNFMRNRTKNNSNNTFNHKRPIPSNFNSNQPLRSTAPPIRQNSYPNFSNSSNFNNRPVQQQGQFPRGPIQIRQNNPQNQNSQIRRPQNNQYPTPMSISTRNTFRPNNTNNGNANNNHFRAQSKPTFTSEELFNIEEDNYYCHDQSENSNQEFYDLETQNDQFHTPINTEPSVDSFENFHKEPLQESLT